MNTVQTTLCLYCHFMSEDKKEFEWHKNLCMGYAEGKAIHNRKDLEAFVDNLAHRAYNAYSYSRSLHDGDVIPWPLLSKFDKERWGYVALALHNSCAKQLMVDQKNPPILSENILAHNNSNDSGNTPKTEL